MQRNLPKETIIDGYLIRQAKNYHVTIIRLSDNKMVLHAQCSKEQDAQSMLDFYKNVNGVN